jgi:hypothetical protein
MASTSVKIAALAPIARPSVPTAVNVNAGALRRARSAGQTSVIA